MNHVDFPFRAPPAPRSVRSRAIADAFELSLDVPTDTVPLSGTEVPLPVAGELVLLTGPSGSGKSTLLREIARRAFRASRVVIDLQRLRLPDRPAADCLPARDSLDDVLRDLSRVGLAEAWTWLRPPRELSEGQRWRLKLAVALARSRRSSNTILVCDEFAALLDRVTAHVVARALRKSIAGSSLSAVVATSHDDLFVPLAPDVTVTCDFGRAEWAIEAQRTQRGERE
jgi:hypothetical protein